MTEDPGRAPVRAPEHRTRLRALYPVKAWLYRGGRPHATAKALNALWAKVFAAGRFAPEGAMTLELRGRRSGRTIAFPVMVARHEGHRYVVSMLGDGANWVRNARAAGGRAVLRHGAAEQVRLVEIDPAERAPVLRAYLAVAPGARPHVPVAPDAPVAEFERIAGRYPVFRVDPAAPTDAAEPGEVTR